MSPLNIALKSPQGEWIKFGTLSPEEAPSSISNHRQDGSREVYLFECEADDKSSTIIRSVGGIETEEVARLKDGESLILPIRNKTVGDVEVRFTHVERR